MPTLPPPTMPEKPQPKDLPELLMAMQEELTATARAAAGYLTLSKVYEQAVAPGRKGRKKGLPIFEYKGSLDEVNVLPLAIDLRKVSAQYLPHILSPFCSVHATEMLEGLSKIHQYTRQAIDTLQAALGLGTVPPTAEPAGEEEEGEPEEVTA